MEDATECGVNHTPRGSTAVARKREGAYAGASSRDGPLRFAHIVQILGFDSLRLLPSSSAATAAASFPLRPLPLPHGSSEKAQRGPEDVRGSSMSLSVPCSNSSLRREASISCVRYCTVLSPTAQYNNEASRIVRSIHVRFWICLRA